MPPSLLGEFAGDYKTAGNRAISSASLVYFVWGRPILASDSEFGRNTNVRRMGQRIFRLDCLALCATSLQTFTAEGDLVFTEFSDLLFLPKTLFVVDEFGCDNNSLSAKSKRN